MVMSGVSHLVILVLLLLHRLLLAIADVEELPLHGLFVGSVRFCQDLHELLAELAILLELQNHLALDDLRHELRKLLFDEQRKTVVLAAVTVLIVCVVGAGELEEHRQREALEVVDVLDHRQLQLLDVEFHTEVVEKGEIFQCSNASDLVIVQLGEETAGEELYGVVVDMLVVRAVVFDGNEGISL
jgi:hypothetical protein